MIIIIIILFIFSFQGMGIIHTAKKFICEELQTKLIDRIEFENNRGCTELDLTKIKNRAENETKSMNLNQVCLCFEALHLVNGRYVELCKPVLSNPINNMSKYRVLA